MQVVVDSMGGDLAPREIVKGAILACKEYGLDVCLIGDENAIRPFINGEKGISIIHAPEVIEMDEPPVQAVRKKRNSSIVKGLELVKSGQADGFVSAGNTGAAMAGALLNLGRLPGVSRPAISALFPTLQGMSIIVDVGANVDCRPNHLQQFALMGSLYTQSVLGRDNPRVGLLNNGEEENKGCELTIATHQLLKEMSQINYIGFIEGRDVCQGAADVIICDGFVGNVMLKFAEGLSSAFFHMLKQEMGQNTRHKLGAYLLLPGLKSIGKRLDYTEYGGAPLLGVNGVCIIAHGSSNDNAIKNAIRVCAEGVQAGIVDKIGAQIEQLDGEGS